MNDASRESARRRRNVPYTAAIVAFVLGVIAVVLVAGYFTFKAWTEAQTRRDQAIPIIATEFTHLPPPGGVSEAQRTVVTDPGRGPDILVVYPQVASCSEVQAYYTQLASAQGWLSKGTQHLGDDIIDTYSKMVSGYDLMLRVDCKSDVASSGQYGGFTVDIHG